MSDYVTLPDMARESGYKLSVIKWLVNSGELACERVDGRNRVKCSVWAAWKRNFLQSADQFCSLWEIECAYMRYLAGQGDADSSPYAPEDRSNGLEAQKANQTRNYTRMMMDFYPDGYGMRDD